jgi:hypothetical protein
MVIVLRRLTTAVRSAGDGLLALFLPRIVPARAADCWIEWWNDADGEGNTCKRRDCCVYASGAVRCSPWQTICVNCNCPP